jgi:hypothetical protein
MPDQRPTLQEQLQLAQRRRKESSAAGSPSGPAVQKGPGTAEPEATHSPASFMGAIAGPPPVSHEPIVQAATETSTAQKPPPAPQALEDASAGSPEAEGRPPVPHSSPDLEVLIELERALNERAASLNAEAASLERARADHLLEEQQLAWQQMALEDSKRKLDAREQDLQRKLALLEIRQKEVGALKEQLDAQAVQQAAKEAELGQREGSVKAKEIKVTAAETRHRTRLQELRAAREEIELLSKQVATLTTSRKRLQTKFDNATAARSVAFRIASWDVAHWMLSGIDVDFEDFADKVAFSGDGPFLQSDLEGSARELGLRVGRCGARNAAKILIVGRDDWDQQAIQAHLDAAGEDELFVFPQELWIASMLISYNPFRCLDEETCRSAVESFGEGHPVIEWLRGLEFPWPEFQVSDDAPSTALEQQVKASPLVRLEYRVGTTNGQPTKERRRILSEAFSTDDLPKADFRDGVRPAMQREYMQSWGGSSSRKRLRRIAWHLAMLINMHSRQQNLETAVEEWQADLAWLRKNHYSPAMRFRWP